MFRVITSLLFVYGTAYGAIDMTKCQPERQGEVPVYNSDFKWGMTIEEIINKANEMYSADKRLAKRAYYDEVQKTFVFPEEADKGGNIKIPASFIKSITRHVEKAMERGYVDAVIFPDMGHSHFLVPRKFYDKEIAPLPVSQTNVLYEKIMKNSEVKVLYHTAEQLKSMNEQKKLLEDKQVQWRYYTRNLVGQNTAEPELELVNATAHSEANTAHEQDFPGYAWWGGGFNIHANKNGCFSFKKAGKVYNYDLSLQDLKSPPGSGGDWAVDN